MSIEANKRENILSHIFQEYTNTVDCIIYVNYEKQSFEKLQGKGFWDQVIPSVGTFEDLKSIFFYQDKNGSTISEREYDPFITPELMKEEDTHGNIIRIIEGIEHKYDYFSIHLDTHCTAIVIKEYPRTIVKDSIEHLKMDTIQETYLFSMLVNLSTDECMNSNTTELSSDNQVYQKFRYSEWRNTIVNLFHEADHATFMKISDPEYIIQKLTEKQRFIYEIEMKNLQGVFIWVKLIFHRIVGFSRENPVFAYTVVDIDQDMKRLLAQNNILKASIEQNEKLKVANQEKNTFISTVSHELRTPLNAIIGMSEVILREDLNNTIKKNLHIIHSASKGLLTIINDLLDLSKIEAGKIEIVKENYHILSIVNDVCAMIKSRNEEKKLDLHFNISETLPSVLHGDFIRIKQVMVNLANNAIKYTDEGSVTISLAAVSLNDGYVKLIYSVEDTGQGIRKEDLPKLFIKYNQLNVQANHHKEGTGLGLSIAKSMIELMGGAIGVESEYGVGSKFYFELPQEVINEKPAGRLEDYSYEEQMNNQQYLFRAPNVRILIVDDNEINLIVAENLLSILELQIDTADNYSKVMSYINKNKYDLIFMDNYMPEVDGIELTGKIRALENNLNQNVPIIALTADAMTGTREKIIAAGMNDCVHKPIEMDKICNVIRNHLPAEYIQDL